MAVPTQFSEHICDSVALCYRPHTACLSFSLQATNSSYTEESASRFISLCAFTTNRKQKQTCIQTVIFLMSFYRNMNL